MSPTHLVPLDRYNWEQCLDLTLKPEQQANIPSVLYSLAQAKFENLTPHGIVHEEEIVGLIMHGEFGGICWISRVIIDANHQRKGIGSTALRHLLRLLGRKISCREIRASYAPTNYAAAALFDGLGFAPMADTLEDEVVVRYRG